MSADSSTPSPTYTDKDSTYLPIVATFANDYSTFASTGSINPDVYPTVNPCGLDPPAIVGQT